MMADGEIVPVQDDVRLGTLAVKGPAEVVSRASEIATALAKVIKDKRLAVPISGKDYVRVEGWTTLGTMLGVVPREVRADRLEDGSYEAEVELVRVSDGMVVGRGSAICGMDEKRWSNADAYARRSMAITRAAGKAYRLAFSWIMVLAGYESTPAEEMPDVVEGHATPLEDWANAIGPDEMDALIEAGVIPPDAHPNHVAALLNLSPFKPGDELDMRWFRHYRGYRDQDKTAKQAAALATKDYRRE